MLATLYPRMQVGNCIQIVDYHGELVWNKKFKRLYQAHWRPEVGAVAVKKYPARDPSPKRHRAKDESVRGIAKLSQKVGAYRPGAFGGGYRLGGLNRTPPGIGVPGMPADAGGKKKKKRNRKQGGNNTSSATTTKAPVSADSAPALPVAVVEAAAQPTVVSVEKTIKKISKTLKQIDQLKVHQCLHSHVRQVLGALPTSVAFRPRSRAVLRHLPLSRRPS